MPKYLLEIEVQEIDVESQQFGIGWREHQPGERNSRFRWLIQISRSWWLLPRSEQKWKYQQYSYSSTWLSNSIANIKIDKAEEKRSARKWKKKIRWEAGQTTEL